MKPLLPLVAAKHGSHNQSNLVIAKEVDRAPV